MRVFRKKYGYFGSIVGLVLAIGGITATAALADGDTPSGGRLNQSVTTGGPVVPKAGEPPKDWRQETEATCGMACRYHRANDNLTMQALYLVTKIGKIEAELKNKADSDSARTALGAFCKSKAEDLEDCFRRYKDFQRVALLELRQSIGKNEDTIARLTQGRKSDGTVDGTALVFETGDKNVPYFPDVPTLSELEESYLQGKLKEHGSKYSRAEIQKWSESLIVNDPRQRYLEFEGKPVVGNPYQKETTSYSLYREKVGPGGKTGEDAKSVGLYKQSEKAIRDFSTDKTIADSETKAVAPTKNLKKDDQLSYEAFIQARSVVNSKIEKDATRADEEEKDRRLASEKGPKPKPSPTPSGTPVVNTNTGVSREVKVTTGGSARRTPSASEMKMYEPDEKIVRPAEMKNSRYIKYDLGDLMNDIDASTK